MQSEQGTGGNKGQTNRSAACLWISLSLFVCVCVCVGRLPVRMTICCAWKSAAAVASCNVFCAICQSQSQEQSAAERAAHENRVQAEAQVFRRGQWGHGQIVLVVVVFPPFPLSSSSPPSLSGCVNKQLSLRLARCIRFLLVLLLLRLLLCLSPLLLLLFLLPLPFSCCCSLTTETEVMCLSKH